MIIKRVFNEEAAEFMYDTSNNYVEDFFSGRNCIDRQGKIYGMLFHCEDITATDIFLEMLNNQ